MGNLRLLPFEKSKWSNLMDNKKQILLGDIPVEIRFDLGAFLIGSTIMPHPSGDICIGKNHFKEWLKYDPKDTLFHPFKD